MGVFSKLFSVGGLCFAPSDHARCQGNIFPLPLPHPPEPINFPESAPSYLRSRERRRQLRYRRVDETVRALNEVSSSRVRSDDSSRAVPSNSHPHYPRGGSVSSFHGEILNTVWSSHVRNRPPMDLNNGPGALTELTRARDLYS